MLRRLLLIGLPPSDNGSYYSRIFLPLFGYPAGLKRKTNHNSYKKRMSASRVAYRTSFYWLLQYNVRDAPA
ncbi:hypothetical protein [Paenibacillus sp. PastM-2]|uniref:hypothetical protein n=1 Tax=Paenibacillus sp. PastM-2 TaxID=2940533 RepID=UPI0024074378|nr:hypothetical protein [Paenibacillus sp. PastM-2]MDF9849481.1 hypothetical protein [Paenibacillus sp. PastM-2]